MMKIEDIAKLKLKESIQRAKATPPEVKIRDSFILFEGVCQRMQDGIKHRSPDLSEADLKQRLLQQLIRTSNIEHKLRNSA